MVIAIMCDGRAELLTSYNGILHKSKSVAIDQFKFSSFFFKTHLNYDIKQNF